MPIADLKVPAQQRGQRRRRDAGLPAPRSTTWSWQEKATARILAVIGPVFDRGLLVRDTRR